MSVKYITPAQLTAMSIFPESLMTLATAACTDSRLVTSVGTQMAPGTSLAAAASDSALRDSI